MDYPHPSPNSATFKKDCNSVSFYFRNTQKLELLTWLKGVTSHFHNATFILTSLISGSQPDDDTMGSKHVAEWILL